MGGNPQHDDAEDDQEGVEDSEIQQKYDEENMKFAQEKINNKKLKASTFNKQN